MEPRPYTHVWCAFLRVVRGHVKWFDWCTWQGGA